MLILEDHCHRLRRPVHLRLEKLMDTFVPRVIRRSVVPLHQNPMALSFSEQRQLPDALIRDGDDSLEQGFKVSRHPLDGRGAEQVAAVRQSDKQSSGRFIHGKHKVELGFVSCLQETARLKAIQRERRVRCPVQSEHHLEQRISADVAAGCELLDQLFEGKVLVRVGGERRLAHLREKLAERGIAGKV